MVKINKNFTPTQNFWELNPQLIIMQPFDRLYATDDGGEVSSKYAWMCFFMKDPDEDDNVFYSLPEEQRVKMLRETYFPDLDLGFKEYVDCLEAYPDICLSMVEKSIMKQKELIRRRDRFLDNMEYTLDSHQVVAGKVQVIPGTFKQLEAAHKTTPQVYKMLKELEELFIQEKSSGEVYGGRRETFSEKGLI